MATIREIALKAEVSATTVSRVLNFDSSLNVSNETREKILKIAKELEYTSKKSRKYDSGKGLGIIYYFNFEEELADPYYLLMRLAIEKRCSENNCNLVSLSENSSVESLKSVSGIIVIGKFSKKNIENLYNGNENIVFIDYCPNENKFDAVVADLRMATFKILNYLYTLGHRKIAFVGGNKITENIYEGDFPNERDIEYKRFMKSKGIYDENYIFPVKRFTSQCGYEVTKDILKMKERPTALFMGNDSMAVGAYKAISEAGLSIPNDISVVGINNQSSASYMIPALTTVKIQSEYLGSAAVDLILEKVNGVREYQKKVVIPVEFIIRESCSEI